MTSQEERDIVERLRARWGLAGCLVYVPVSDVAEAADTIERLRAELENMTRHNNNACADYWNPRT